MSISPPSLFVAWQDADSRRMCVVGQLRTYKDGDESGYEFVYVNGALEARSEHGFHPFISFPELDVAYRSTTLFPFFTNRVLPATRPDYPEYVRELGLNSEDVSPETLLARSGGKRATDRIELFAPPRLDPKTGMHEIYVLLRGLRHMPESAGERIRTLTPDTRLYCMVDVQNPRNPGAIALRTEDMYLLGYLPDYLVDDLAMVRARGLPILVDVVRMNPPPAPRWHRLLCRVRGRWPEDHAPFSNPRFQPMVAAFNVESATV